MIYRLLADVLVVVHLGFIIFVVAGGFVALRWPKVAWLHLPTALWGAAIEFTGGVCPLTPLENRMRALGGEAGYAGGFIDHYVTPIVYPAGLGRQTQVVIGIAVVLVNVIAYALLYRKRWKPLRKETS